MTDQSQQNKIRPDTGKNISTWIDLLAISSLLFVSLIISNPLGNFPLNDDWSFGLTVRHFIDSGDFRPTGWTSMPLITHVVWGSVFCLPSGFSFQALRISTLTISLIGLFGTYLLIRELKGSRWIAVIVALTIAFNPIYYALSNTYMTDIPFSATMTLAVLFFVRSLKNDSLFDLFAGSIFAVAATLNRQLGIAVPLAFAVSLFLKNGFTRRVLVRAIIPPVLCIGALIVFGHWLEATGRLPVRYNDKSFILIQKLTDPGMLLDFVKNAFKAILYLGLFLSPVLILYSDHLWFNLKGKSAIRLTLVISASILLGVVSLILWQSHHLMPLSGNILNTSGIGPLTLRDTDILNAPHIATLPVSFWLIITAISLLGGALLVSTSSIISVRLLPAFWSRKMNSSQAVSAFLFLSTVVYMIPLLVQGFFDRYLIPVIPFLAAYITCILVEDHAQSRRTGEKVIPVVALVLIGLFSVFSVCGTRDYLAWNRARWEILNDLMDGKRVKAEEIDGGFEFNGLYMYDPVYHQKPDKSWWWVKGDKFVVSFGAIPGYSVIREYKYRQWLPLNNGSIMLLEKNVNDSVLIH
jgi:4-amino-4-deoxy-L-arabinose transferase-like glycosyltransferase